MLSWGQAMWRFMRGVAVLELIAWYLRPHWWNKRKGETT
jgi:hypothetical protein